MSRYGGLDPRYSNRNDFFSDENLAHRASPASYADYAPGPNEDVADAMRQSYSLRMAQARGQAITPLQVQDVEVDGESPVEDYSPPPNPYSAASASYSVPPVQASQAPPNLSDAQMDDLASRIARKLQGG